MVILLIGIGPAANLVEEGQPVLPAKSSVLNDHGPVFPLYLAALFSGHVSLKEPEILLGTGRGSKKVSVLVRLLLGADSTESNHEFFPVHTPLNGTDKGLGGLLM